MEKAELDLIERYRKEDQELDSLWVTHLEYEKQLKELSEIPFPTPEDEMKIKDIKKMKLAGKTRLHQLLERYKKEK